MSGYSLLLYSIYTNVTGMLVRTYTAFCGNSYKGIFSWYIL